VEVHDCRDEWHNPQTEYDFNLAEEVHRLSENIHRTVSCFAYVDLLCVRMPTTVANRHKRARHESMDYCAEEDQGSDQVEWFKLDAIPNYGAYTIKVIVAVAFEA
jgi:hypothetical protein